MFKRSESSAAQVEKKLPSPDYETYVLGFIMGCLVAASIVTTSLAIYLAYSGILKYYQALTAAMIALVGAIGTIYAIRRQIGQTYELAEDHRQRQNYAARTMLPAALAALRNYAAECLNLLKSIKLQANFGMLDPNDPDVRPPPVPPTIPENSLTILRDCVAWGDTDAQKSIADLVAKLQIQNSRLVAWFRYLSGRSGANRAMHHSDNPDDYMIDALEIHARCGALFPYARRDPTTVIKEIDFSRMTNAASNNNIDDSEHPELYEEMQSRYDA